MILFTMKIKKDTYIVYERPPHHLEPFKLSDLNTFKISKNHVLIFDKPSVFSNELLLAFLNQPSLPESNIVPYLYRKILIPMMKREKTTTDYKLENPGFYLVTPNESIQIEDNYDVKVIKSLASHGANIKTLYPMHDLIEKSPSKALIQRMYERIRKHVTFVMGRGIIYHLNKNVFYDMNWEAINDSSH